MEPEIDHMKPWRKQITIVVGVLMGMNLGEVYSDNAAREETATDRVVILQQRLMDMEEAREDMAVDASALHQSIVRRQAEMHLMVRRLPQHDEELKELNERIHELRQELAVLQEELRERIETHAEFRELRDAKHDEMVALSAKRVRMSALNDERIRLEAELDKQEQSGFVPHE